MGWLGRARSRVRPPRLGKCQPGRKISQTWTTRLLVSHDGGHPAGLNTACSFHTLCGLAFVLRSRSIVRLSCVRIILWTNTLSTPNVFGWDSGLSGNRFLEYGSSSILIYTCCDQGSSNVFSCTRCQRQCRSLVVIAARLSLRHELCNQTNRYYQRV